MRQHIWRLVASALILPLLAAWKGAAGPNPHPLAPIIKQVITPKKVVALTFDDGPSAKWTPQILAVLRRDHVHATFFVIGSHAIRHPALLQDEVQAGEEIGNHGAQHRILRGKSAAEVRHEVEENQRILTALGAHPAPIYRMPGGASDHTALQVLGSLGYRVIGWSIDPRDWRHRYTAEEMATMVTHKIAPGSIVIFHDGPNSSQATVDAVSTIIPTLQQQGYQFMTVSHLLKEERITPMASS